MILINVARLGRSCGEINRLIPTVLSIFYSNHNISALNKLKYIRYYSTPVKAVHDLSTNVAKDVILFKYENPRYFRLMNIFALVQYGFWAYLCSFVYTMRDAPIDKDKIDESTPFIMRINLGENKYKNGLASFSLLIGVATLCLVWMYTLKSVRYLVLHKGGKDVTFVTYTPLGRNRMMKVPLQNVCCKQSRQQATSTLPLKVKNTTWHYILDMKGEFKNGPLFDSTAGLYRKL